MASVSLYGGYSKLTREGLQEYKDARYDTVGGIAESVVGTVFAAVMITIIALLIVTAIQQPHLSSRMVCVLIKASILPAFIAINSILVIREGLTYTIKGLHRLFQPLSGEERQTMIQPQLPPRDAQIYDRL